MFEIAPALLHGIEDESGGRHGELGRTRTTERVQRAEGGRGGSPQQLLTSSRSEPTQLHHHLPPSSPVASPLQSPPQIEFVFTVAIRYQQIIAIANLIAPPKALIAPQSLTPHAESLGYSSPSISFRSLSALSLCTPPTSFSLTHSFTRSLTHPLTHSLTHSLARCSFETSYCWLEGTQAWGNLYCKSVWGLPHEAAFQDEPALWHLILTMITRRKQEQPPYSKFLFCPLDTKSSKANLLLRFPFCFSCPNFGKTL